MHKSMQTWSRVSAVFQTKCQNEEEMWGRNVTLAPTIIPWSDRVVWVSQKLLISWDFHFHEYCKKQKWSSEQKFCRQNRVVNERGQKTRAKLVEPDRKLTVIQINIHYDSGMSDRSVMTARRNQTQNQGYSEVVIVYSKSGSVAR